MKSRLLRKLLLIVLLVILLAILIIWLAIDLFAGSYFSFLMERYNLPKAEVQHIFLDAAHRYILVAGFVGMAVAIVSAFFLIRRVLKPIYQMGTITGKVAQGDYSRRVTTTSSDEIGQLAKSFNRMTDSLERFERLREDMVANVAHELRDPLTNMRGYLEALSNKVLPPSQETFDLLHQETLRLVTLTDELLLLSKADSARSSLDLRKMRLADCVRQVLEIFRVQLDAKAITVEEDLTCEFDEVMADEDKLGQVIRNLLQNALQYTPSGGRVGVAIKQSPGWVKAIFTNTGDGITEKDLPFIFERFYRAEKSRSREYGGAGIGLAIVKGLVEAHGGQTGAESSATETCVWFTLPQ